MTDEQLEEGLDAIAGANWVWNVVQTFAFLHADSGDQHLGWTYMASHYARCGNCEWEIDPSASASARARGTFGLAALAMVGATFQAISEEQRRRLPLITVPVEW